jgi:hypothetical protein
LNKNLIIITVDARLKEGMELRAKREEELRLGKTVNMEAEYNKAKRQRDRLIDLMLDEDANIPLLKEKERSLTAVITSYETQLRIENQNPVKILEKSNKTINL